MMVVSVLTTVVLPPSSAVKKASLISAIKSDVEFVARTVSPPDARLSAQLPFALSAAVRPL